MSETSTTCMKTISTHLLNCKRTFLEYLVELKDSPPDLLWVSLPGSRTNTGNHTDRKLALHIYELEDAQLKQGKHVVVEAGPSNLALRPLAKHYQDFEKLYLELQLRPGKHDVFELFGCEGGVIQVNTPQASNWTKLRSQL